MIINIEIDIWKLKNDYIMGIKPDGQIIEIDLSHALTRRHKNSYWDWPLHFAEKSWCTEEHAMSLIKIISIIKSNGHSHLEVSEDIDDNTIAEVRRIIDEKNISV